MGTISLTNSDLVAIVPDEYEDQCRKLKWAVHYPKGERKPYVQGWAYGGKGQKQIRWSLHRYVWYLHTGEKSDRQMVVDHIDGNPLNNALDNLRRITNAQNAQRERKGVYYHYQGKRINCWRARVRVKVDGKSITLFNESFATEQEAIDARNAFKRDHGIM